jgi:hypothetical protein
MTILPLKNRPGTAGKMNSASEPSSIRWALFCRKAAANFGFSLCKKIITGRSGSEAAYMPGRKKFC